MVRKATRMPIGYVRDRSKVYQEKWEALHPNRGANIAGRGHGVGQSEEARLLGDSGARNSDFVGVEMRPMHNSLMAAEQNINTELQAARADLQALTQLQSAAQEDLFGQKKGQTAAVEERRRLLRARIRVIHGMINELGSSDSDPDSAAVAARVKRAKATALNEIAMELNRKEIADIQSRTPHGVPGMDRSRMDAVFSQLAEPTPAYAEQQMRQLTDMQHVYAERDETVAELIKEVTEIQEVMRDISVLVVEQGSMVDRIDQNIGAAGEAVERGVEHIRKAHESSKSGAMATCIFVLLILIAIMFVLMLIRKL